MQLSVPGGVFHLHWMNKKSHNDLLHFFHKSGLLVLYIDKVIHLYKMVQFYKHFIKTKNCNLLAHGVTSSK